MNAWWTCYFPIFFLIVIVLSGRRQTKKYVEARIKKRNGDKEMQKLAERLMGKDIIVNTLSSGAMDGILKEVSDNGIVIAKNGKEEFINLDFVIRMREYPVNKKGKRKVFVFE